MVSLKWCPMVFYILWKQFLKDFGQFNSIRFQSINGYWVVVLYGHAYPFKNLLKFMAVGTFFW